MDCNEVLKRELKPSFCSRWNIFKIGSRIGRVQYLGLSSAWTALILILAFLASLEYIHLYVALVFLPMIIFKMFSLHIRRLNDLNYSGWWSLFGGIPYLGVLIYLICLFFPGTEGENRFGSQSELTSRKYYFMCLIIPALVLMMLLIKEVGRVLFTI